MSTFTCPVCHYPGLSEQPYSDAGPSFEICPSCGFEFGVSDDDQGHTPDTWRAAWAEEGFPWRSTAPRPSGWDGRRQLSS